MYDYDPETGYPVTVWVEPDTNIDEHWIDFAELADPDSVAHVEYELMVIAALEKYRKRNK